MATVASSLYRIDVHNCSKQLNTFWPVRAGSPGASRRRMGSTRPHRITSTVRIQSPQGRKGMPGWVPRGLRWTTRGRTAGYAISMSSSRSTAGATRTTARTRRRAPAHARAAHGGAHRAHGAALCAYDAARKRIPYLKYGEPVFEVWYDTKYKEAVQSGLSILMILLITLLLGVMGYLLSRDVNQIVIIPVENMVDSVTKLAANPAFKMEKVHKVVYETDALKLSLSKIATMLQVGFGEAGNNLVAENLKETPSIRSARYQAARRVRLLQHRARGEVLSASARTSCRSQPRNVDRAAVTENGGQPNRNLGEASLRVEARAGRGRGGVAGRSVAETKMCDGALTFRGCVRGISSGKKLQAWRARGDRQVLRGGLQDPSGTACTRLGHRRRRRHQH